jgi:hypothetical protein
MVKGKGDVYDCAFIRGKGLAWSWGSGGLLLPGLSTCLPTVRKIAKMLGLDV